MGNVSSYRPGQPCWVTLSTNQLDRVKGFYRGLLGWEYREKQLSGGARFVLSVLGERVVAGIIEMGDELADEPVSWGTFLATNDPFRTAQRILEAGGSVTQEATAIPGSGTMVVAVDSAGQRIGFWKAADFIGTQVRQEPGAVVWHELASKDVPAAQQFYRQVSDLESFSRDVANLGDYTTFTLAGQPVAGATRVRAGMGPGWAVYFSVPDCDAAARACRELGGSVITAPLDIPFGRMATLTDPAGAQFSVLAG